MSYNYRKSISAKGHPKDELLSALQKYIRRGESAKALYVGIEVELFSEIPAAKPLVTNLVNRLRVTMVEETAGLTSHSLPTLFDALYREFERNRTGIDRADDAKRRAAFLSMIVLLCEARKQRLLSDIKARYFTPDAESFARASGVPELSDLFVCAMYTLDPLVVARRYALTTGDDAGGVVREIVDGLITNIKRQSYHGFYYLNKLCVALETGVSFGSRRIAFTKRADNHPIYLLFELAGEYAKKGARLWDASAPAPSAVWTKNMLDTLQVCFDYYRYFGLRKAGAAKSHHDWIVFTLWPLFYCVRDVPWMHVAPRARLLYTPEQAQTVYAHHRAANAAVIDDYAIDQHTARGRGLKRKGDFFAHVAAHVENEDESLREPALRNLYIKFKEHQAALAQPVSANSQQKRSKKRTTTTNEDDDN